MSTEALHLRFPARSEYLLLARLIVGRVAWRMALGRTEVADLKLAVTEACSNAVRHAYPATAPGEIELEVVAGDDRLELVVRDHGTGIALPLPAPTGLFERGGMGLPIIRAVVDELEIRPGRHGGTVVHMTKLAAGGTPPTSAKWRFRESADRGIRAGRVRDQGTASGSLDFRLEEDHPQPGTVVVSVHGDLDLHSADELGDRLVGTVDDGASLLVVDLSDVEFVDSQGLGALLRGTRRLGGGAERFRLIVPAPQLRRIFEITALDRVFPLDETREQALARAATTAASEDAVSDDDEEGMTSK